MALQVSAMPAPARVNGSMSPSPAEDEEMYTQLLRLRDAVIAGKHPHFKLPRSAIEQLKATLVVPAEPEAAQQTWPNGAANISAYAANQRQSVPTPAANGLPGLQASNSISAKPSSSGLDPIFLEKSDSLVRAEGQLKRQRIEKDLQVQVDLRKHTAHGRDAGVEGPITDVDAILKDALERVPPVSGLRSEEQEGSDTSFDENDYYSSQVQSDWSSDPSPSKGSDKGLGAFVDDYERVDNATHGPTSFAESSRSAPMRASYGSALASASQYHPQSQDNDGDEDYEPQIEDEEYTPPDAATFGSFQYDGTGMDLQRATPPDDDNSDYEPGEITQESAMPTPNYRVAHASPQVPVIHNRLTHIAAPQPNRVSPLATAKGPSIELELVNGRPEVVYKPQPQRRSNRLQGISSRVSTDSPPDHPTDNAGWRSGRSKHQQRLQEKRDRREKRAQNKRKRNGDQDLPPSNKKRRDGRDRQAGGQSPVSPAQREPYIKDEPVSPPPFANVPEAPPYGQPQYGPPQVDLVPPQHAPQMQYAQHPSESAFRYEYAHAPPPAVVRLASPIAARPVQRDTQDLRRIASMHLAQRPVSPTQRHYSPIAPYRAASMAYGEQQQPLQLQAAPASRETPRYQEMPPRESVQYMRAGRDTVPPAMPEQSDPYSTRPQSPVSMAPPPPRRIVVDQFGNRYYAAESAPPAAPSMRASVAPVERMQQQQPMYERAPSRAAYAQTPTVPQFPPVPAGMLLPPGARRGEESVEYMDERGFLVKHYSDRPQYRDAPKAPAYQPPTRYEQMPPPPAPPAREPTSPVYQQLPRAYSVRPEEPPQPAPSYMRQASVAPVQYVRQDMPPPPPPPARAVSVMPGSEYGTPVQPQQPMYSYAPQAVKYVDQFGREVFPQQVRQVSEFRYQ